MNPGFVYLAKISTNPNLYGIRQTANAHLRFNQTDEHGDQVFHVIPVEDMDGVETFLHGLFHDKSEDGKVFALTNEDICMFFSFNARTVDDFAMQAILYDAESLQFDVEVA